MWNNKFFWLLILAAAQQMLADSILNNLNSPLPSNCDEVMKNVTNKEGVYLLSIPSSKLPPFLAYCDSDGWTIVQRRRDGKENFYRNWEDYKNGFGDLYGEFWLGLERLHAMTNDRPYTLQVMLSDYRGDTRFANYHGFIVGSEEDAYKLSGVFNYTGLAGDPLYYYDGVKFSTFDRNNAVGRENFAVIMNGGFWYKSDDSVNLNGPYHQFANRNTHPGVFWSNSDAESLRYVHMALRPTSAIESIVN